MARIGVFGGSFDPVHEAHARLVERALAQCELSRVLIVPAFRSPHKSTPEAAPADRVHMLRLQFAAEPRVHIDECELRSGSAQPTVRTLEFLRAEHADAEWVLLLGQDGFESLERWAQPQRLSESCELAVMPRPGGSRERPTRWREAKVLWLSGDALELSSHAMRLALARGERTEGLSGEVLAYIRAQGLYGSGRRR